MAKVYVTRRETFSSAHRLHSKALSDEDNRKVRLVESFTRPTCTLAAVRAVQQPTWSWSQLCCRGDNYRTLLILTSRSILFLKNCVFSPNVWIKTLRLGDCGWEGWLNHWDGGQHIRPQGLHKLHPNWLFCLTVFVTERCGSKRFWKRLTITTLTRKLNPFLKDR